MTNPVKVQLHVAVAERTRALVTIVYDNVSDRPIWILKPAPSLFVECGGVDVADVGPSEKRRPYTLEDYEAVPPGKSATRQVDISAQFDWRPGTNTYVVQTGGGYTDPQTQARVEAPLATATFTLSR